MQIRRRSESLRRLADCSQPVLGRREYFHVLRLFNALQAGKFSHAVFQGAARVDGDAAGACKYCGERKSPPRPRLVAPSPSSAVEKISTFCAFSMRCRQENFASPFRSRDSRCRVRRSAGAAGTSRAAVFASSRRRGRRRRRPKIACPRRECATSVHPPTSLERATPSDGCRRRRTRIASHRSAKHE